MNCLMLSVGRQVGLLKLMKRSMGKDSKIVATDMSIYAPALYMADNYYLVPSIDDHNYIDILDCICKREQINAITTFIDQEIEILAKNRKVFKTIGVEVLAPYEETARLCNNKYLMFEYLAEHKIPTVKTWDTLEDFDEAYRRGSGKFPVFVKPRIGSGSVGARTISDRDSLLAAMSKNYSLIIQEFMDCIDIDADVYVDTVSHEVVSAFTKRKLETKLGGASKTVSFKDEKLFEFIKEICSIFEFNGPVDMDFFYKDGQYYLSEINPRFGSAYLHAHGAGVDFIKLLKKNLRGEKNKPNFGKYEKDIVMMRYDGVVIKKMASDIQVED